MTKYIIDFLNVFSDYREIIYKFENKDFHKFKETNLKIDLFNYFEFFTSKFIPYLKLNNKTKPHFIFIVKSIKGIENHFIEILQKYKDKNFKLEFYIITSFLNSQIIDKNKDDVLVQFLHKSQPKSIIISNDKYKDTTNYIDLFNKMPLVCKVLEYNNKNDGSFSYNKRFVIDNVKNLEIKTICVKKKELKLFFLKRAQK